MVKFLLVYQQWPQSLYQKLPIFLHKIIILETDLLLQVIHVEMANISTKPYSCDDGLVNRLSISTNISHKTGFSQFKGGQC